MSDKEELLEVAKEITERAGFHSNTTIIKRLEEQAALLRRVAETMKEGWVSVPEEPTGNMIHAGYKTGVYKQYRGWGQEEYHPVSCYKAMIAARLK